ncbi:transcription initiation factor TFIID subunit 7-like isoform X1 [Watersipora subatra]|uniref:transcription initiation factor TFIID subunit 7-like isoform X1 n=1 Tax=Watersipora subatra TaxID=2589382 RepID=UPI00355BFEDB
MSGKGKLADSKRKDDIIELEQQFILRLPPGQAMALNHEIESGNYLKDNLFIDQNPESRWGHVRYGGEVITSKLVDLPCIIETLKTTDNKTFYKTADICQMLIASNDMDPSDDGSESPRKKKDKEKKYAHPHGVVPPLKNVKKRRFRKTLRKKPIDLASIEKEVKRLLRMDLEAQSVKTEEFTDDDAQGTEGNPGNNMNLEAGGGDMQLDEEKLFGEISSSEDEAEVNIDEDSESEMARPLKSEYRGGSDIDGAAADGEDEDDDDVIIERIMALKHTLSAVETRISQQEAEIRELDNPDLRRRFEAVLDELYAEKSELVEKIYRMENM